MDVVLPDVFHNHLESVKPLARAKRQAAKDFKWTRRFSLQKATALAYWLYIFERRSEAMEVCRFLAQARFTDGTKVSAWIEGSLALYARLLRSQEQPTEALVCMERIRKVIEQTYSSGVPQLRLNGTFLRDYETNVAIGVRDKRKSSERIFRLSALRECCTLIELGGSVALPVDVLEEHVKEHITRLREIA